MSVMSDTQRTQGDDKPNWFWILKHSPFFTKRESYGVSVEENFCSDYPNLLRGRNWMLRFQGSFSYASCPCFPVRIWNPELPEVYGCSPTRKQKSSTREVEAFSRLKFKVYFLEDRRHWECAYWQNSKTTKLLSPCCLFFPFAKFSFISALLSDVHVSSYSVAAFCCCLASTGLDLAHRMCLSEMPGHRVGALTLGCLLRVCFPAEPRCDRGDCCKLVLMGVLPTGWGPRSAVLK